MNLLLTGASGFLGRNVLLRAPADWRIVALYSQDQGFPSFVAGLQRPGITAVRCNLLADAEIAALVDQHGTDWDCCLYFAAKVDIPWSVRDPNGDLLANTVPLVNLLERVRVDRFVYLSSGAVYDGLKGEVTPAAPVAPTLPYAISKLACEQYVQFFRQRRTSIRNSLIVRFFGAYGPYEATHKIYTRLIRALAVERRDCYTIYGDGTNLIDAMFVADAVEAIEGIVRGDHWNRTVNLAGGNPVTVETLVRSAAEALELGSIRIEKVGVANEKNEFWGSARDMRELYGFVPRTTLVDGIRQLRDFLVAESHAA